MSLSSVTAKQLCTKSEFELFSESLSRNIGALSLRSVKSRVTRSRKLRDKYRDLANQQKRQMRGKAAQRQGRAVTGNENTRKKQTLFSETLARYQKQQKLLEAKERKAEAAKNKAAKKTSKKASKKTAKKTRAGATSGKKKVKKKTSSVASRKKKKAAKKAARSRKSQSTSRVLKGTGPAASRAKQRKLKAGGQTRIHKHISAQNKRRQAKRDS